MIDEINIRRFHPVNDYEDVRSWWIQHRWTPVSLMNLPKIGFLAETAKEKLSCVWLYQTDSKIAWMEWLISNPKSSMKERRVSLDRVIKRIVFTAKDLGFHTLFTSVQMEGLKKRYEILGFKVSDTDMYNMTKDLTGTNDLMEGI